MNSYAKLPAVFAAFLGVLSGTWTAMKWQDHHNRICKEESAAAISSSLVSSIQSSCPLDAASCPTLRPLKEVTCVQGGAVYLSSEGTVLALAESPEPSSIPIHSVPRRYWETGGNLWLERSVIHCRPLPSSEGRALLCLQLPVLPKETRKNWFFLAGFSFLPVLLASSVIWILSPRKTPQPGNKPSSPELEEAPPPRPPILSLPQDAQVVSYLDAEGRLWPLTAGWIPSPAKRDREALHLSEVFEDKQTTRCITRLVEAAKRKGRALSSELPVSDMRVRVIPLSLEDSFPNQFAVVFAATKKEDQDETQHLEHGPSLAARSESWGHPSRLKEGQPLPG